MHPVELKTGILKYCDLYTVDLFILYTVLILKCKRYEYIVVFYYTGCPELLLLNLHA